MALGTDIIEVDRIRSSLKQYGAKFLSKILTEEEILYCMKFKDQAPSIAGKFAAKEAVAKALGTGFGEALDFHDIAILNENSGKPYVKLSEKASTFFNHPQFEISISHCKSHAIAVVIAKSNNL